MNALPTPGNRILVENRTLRLFTLFILYVAQGLPIGLFWFAIPAWMAANGADAADVGFVLGLTALPWSLKLVNGFLMDRYTFLPMGRRRIWLIGAQLVMVILLVVCASIDPAVDDIALLGAAGFLVNMATTFQDVSVDGLAVDIMKEEEHARASGMMFGGQAIGISVGTALTGMVISIYGASAAYLATAMMIIAVTLYMALLRERPGERYLPWTPGKAHPRNLAIHVGAWRPILFNTLKIMFRKISLLWIPVLMVRGFHYGILIGVTPLIGTGNVGWNEAEVTSTVGTAQLVGGILGLTLGGWLGDRFGAKRATVGVFLVFMAMSAVMRLALPGWGNPALYIGFIYTWAALDVLLIVVALPISMRLCDPRVAATQFTIYMAIYNFGTTIGAWILGLSDALGGLPMMFVLVFLMHGIGLVLMLLVAFPKHSPDPEVTRNLPEGEGPAPIRN